MKCPNCGSAKMIQEKADYQYTESGLQNVVIVGIKIHKCNECKEILPEIPHIKELHMNIARALLYKKGLLDGEEIRFLRKELRLKSGELADLLGVDKANLSKWEKSEKEISPSSDRLLRYIYAMRIMAAGHSVLKDAIEKVDIPQVIQNEFRQLEAHTKTIKKTPIKPQLISIDPAIMTA